MARVVWNAVVQHRGAVVAVVAGFTGAVGSTHCVGSPTAPPATAATGARPAVELRLVDFVGDASAAEARFKHWAKSLWVAPNSTQRPNIDSIEAAYFPYWYMTADVSVTHDGGELGRVEKRQVKREKPYKDWVNIGRSEPDVETESVEAYVDGKKERYEVETTVTIINEPHRYKNGKLVTYKEIKEIEEFPGFSPVGIGGYDQEPTAAKLLDSNTNRVGKWNETWATEVTLADVEAIRKADQARVLPIGRNPSKGAAEGATDKAIAAIRADAVVAARKDLLGRTHTERERYINWDTALSPSVPSCALVPVYVVRYHIGGEDNRDNESAKRYLAVVNGQSGAVHGERPLSYYKVGGMVITFPVALLYYWYSSLTQAGPPPFRASPSAPRLPTKGKVYTVPVTQGNPVQ